MANTGIRCKLVSSISNRVVYLKQDYFVNLAQKRNVVCCETETAIYKSFLRFVFGNNFKLKVNKFVSKSEAKLSKTTNILANQSKFIAAHRLKRTLQIFSLYTKLYNDKKNILLHKLKLLVKLPKLPLSTLLAASVAFTWDEERIKDSELKSCTDEIIEVEKMVETQRAVKEQTSTNSHDDWDLIVNKPDLMVWRQLVPDSYLYRYRIFGHFNDITARAFYNTQVDLSYWKDWDTNTMEVQVLDKDSKTNTEVVHWVYRFPYPMYPRDYVYVRRYVMNPTSNTMVIRARSITHPSCPENSSYVRIYSYDMTMVIKPNTDIDSNGFAYMMTYFDDPQTNFPTVAYKWMATAGIEDFLQRVHRAATKKHDRLFKSAHMFTGKGFHKDYDLVSKNA